jgi:hypothetical protein
MTAPRRPGPGGRAAVLAWALWALGLLCLVAIGWFDQLLRSAGRPDLVQLNVTALPYLLAGGGRGDPGGGVAVPAGPPRLRDELDLNTLRGELLAVVDQTIQPNQASLWLGPSRQPRVGPVPE